MAGNSFADGGLRCSFVDPYAIDLRLEWNPHPRDRGEAIQERWWDWMDRRESDTVSESVQSAAESYWTLKTLGNMPPAIHFGGPEQNVTDWSMRSSRRMIIIGPVGQ